MSGPAYSPLWYRVANLKPTLREHVAIRPHKYRNRQWYVAADRAQGRFHRLSHTAYYLVGLMDGNRTVEEVWRISLDTLEDDAPTQDDIIRLLGKLYAHDVLRTEVRPDVAEMFRRAERARKGRVKKGLWNPLYIRLPLWDPERFLTRCQRWVNPLFSTWGLIAWSLVVGTGALLGLRHWDGLTHDFIDRVLSADNLLLLWLTYPVIKAVHELGHAFATKVWGGEVHEMGVTLLALTPIPYVDASAASAFTHKRERVFVGAAGIMVEMFLAALALLVWITAEPGIVRAVAYNIVLIGSLSTLLFNANPLLRFDGYFVLCDMIEIPGLGPRSNRYLTYLVQRHLFRLDQSTSPAESLGERVWFVAYGVSSFFYRIIVLFAVLLTIGSKFLFLGAILALWALSTLIVTPLVKAFRYLLYGAELQRHRPRAIGVTLTVLAALLLAFFALPVSNTTTAEGVVWPPEQAQIRSGTDCVVTRVIQEADAAARAGDPVLACEDPFITTEERILAAKLAELDARHAREPMEERAERRILREQIRTATADLSRIRERMEALVIRSPADGRIIVTDAENLPGRFVHQGNLLGYVLNPGDSTVKVAVSQDDIGQLQRGIRRVDVMVSGRLGRNYPATLQRQTPAASGHLPTPALGRSGGGSISVNPVDETGTEVLQSVFVLDVLMAPEAVTATIGRRVFVRFDHGAEPLAFQLYRRLRQVFLSRLSV